MNTVRRCQRKQTFHSWIAREKRKRKTAKKLSISQKLKSILDDKDNVVLIFVIDRGENRRMRLNRKKNDICESTKRDENIKESKGSISKTKKSQVQKPLKKESSQLRKSFPCNICGRALSTKANLQRHHSLKHSEQANF